MSERAGGEAALGLVRGTVRLVEPSDDWPRLFTAMARTVTSTDTGRCLVAIHHIGSTSVPGLPAKPIIDMCAVHRDDASLGPLVDALCRNGWELRGSNGIPDRTFLVLGNPTQFHLHALPERSSIWKHYLRFRDLLRSDDELRARYGAHKRRLVETLSNDRRAYQRQKSEFVIRVLVDVGVEPPPGGWLLAP